MGKPLVSCPKCGSEMRVSSEDGVIDHFYCIHCKEVFLIKNIDWSKQMSTKATMIHARTKDFMIHIYQCSVRGYGIDIMFKEFNTTLLVDKNQAESLVRQLEFGK